MERLEKGHLFVVRISTGDFKREQQSMKGNDEEVEICFTKERVNPYRYTLFAQQLKEKKSIRLRFVKVVLSGGITEILATNLPRDEFPAKDISRLFQLRWGIETAYDTLKNKYMLENFTGKKPILIEQDILATLCVYNMAQDMIRDAEIEQREKDRNKHYRHPMTINVNLAIGVIKEDLIRVILERDREKQSALFEEMIQTIAGHIVPVREGRHYERHNKHPALKHPMNKKHSY